MIRTTILAGALATLGLVSAPASAQPSPKCHNPIEAIGVGQGAFGAGTKKAKAAVIVEFEQKALQLYGPRYAKFSKAKTVKQDCRSGAVEAKCVITARPCR